MALGCVLADIQEKNELGILSSWGSTNKYGYYVNYILVYGLQFIW